MKQVRIWLATTMVIALVAGVAVPAAWAKKLEGAEIFIEINDTDGDAGVQIFLDGEGWDAMQVRDPNGNVILNIAAEGSVGQQGVTELFFESAEPSFDVQTLDELLALFPEGVYRFEGTTTEGKKVRGKTRLKHAIPDAPVLVHPVEDGSVFFDDAVIQWMAVADPPGSRIIGYQVIVETDDDGMSFTVDLGRDARRVRVPPEFMDPGTEYKFEVLAIEKNGNRTASEREFTTRN